MPGSGLLVSPLHEEAVGQPGEHGVEPEGAIRAQPTLIVAAGDIEPGMEPVFDAPSIPVEGEPAFGVEFPGGQAGQEGDGLGAQIAKIMMRGQHLPAALQLAVLQNANSNRNSNRIQKGLLVGRRKSAGWLFHPPLMKSFPAIFQQQCLNHSPQTPFQSQ